MPNVPLLPDSLPETIAPVLADRLPKPEAYIDDGLNVDFLRSIIDQIEVPIIACDAKGMVVLINQAFAMVHQVPDRQMPIDVWLEQFTLFERDGTTPMKRSDAPMLRALRGEVLQALEYSVLSPTGDLRFRRAWGHQLTDGNGTVLGAVVALHDTTNQRRAEDALRHQALHDPLTGLPNRSLLRDRLHHALARAKRRNRPVAVVFFDLDRFKRINDSFGHTVGDEMLVITARRLKGILRPEDTLGRLGGDEFVIILEELDHPSDARRVGDRIRSLLSEPMDVGSQMIRTTASVGVALADPNRHTAEDLLREADTAMYGAKERGRDRTEVFDEAMHQRALQRIATEQMLVQTLQNDRLVVLYQPIVDSATGRMVGAEALVRCAGDNGELLSPASFVSVAEETGLISEIDLRVLKRVCAVAAELAGERPGRELRFSCNVSGRFVDHDDFVTIVSEVMAAAGCPPTGICLEITETTLLQATPKTRSGLAELRAAGVQIAIDDFGTGYSSLTYLRDFPISDLKIDRSFIARMWQDGDLAIVDAVVRLAVALGMLVTAEGVESRDQAVTLRRLGVAQLQGHWFGRAMPAEELRAKLLDEVPGFV
jgi:diguanylate cyclase (GGDEF)-like protein